MPNILNQEIHLVSRPCGIPTAANFALVRTEVAPLQDQQVLVRNLFMSVDPYMRGRMNEGKSYVPPFELGQPLFPTWAGGNILWLHRKTCIRSAVRPSRFRFTWVLSA